MSLIHNERIKLTANWLNTLATALVATGAIAPVAAWLYGFPTATADPLTPGFLSAACSLSGATLHYLARTVIEGMTSLELLALAMPVLTAVFAAVFAFNVHRFDNCSRLVRVALQPPTLAPRGPARPVLQRGDHPVQSPDIGF